MYTASEKLSSANITDIILSACIECSMSVILSRVTFLANHAERP